MAKERVYSAKILKKGGSLDNSVFEKMVERGDVTSKSVKEMVDSIVKVSGYAEAHIDTSDNSFDILYVNTDKGIISTGSSIFKTSLFDYIDDMNTFRVVQVKCKKGVGYKLMPEFTDVDLSEPTEEIPFN